MGRAEALESSQREALLLRFIGPLCFALTAAATKRASVAFTSFEITMVRSAVNLTMTMALLVADAIHGGVPLWQQRMRCPRLLLLRGIFGCLAILCYTESLAQLPLAIALTISRLHPILGGIFSSAMLGERFRLPPIVVGLAGVALVATAKDGGGDHGHETALPAYGVVLAPGIRTLHYVKYRHRLGLITPAWPPAQVARP